MQTAPVMKGELMYRARRQARLRRRPSRHGRQRDRAPARAARIATILTADRATLDLRDQARGRGLDGAARSRTLVFLAAAKVGGILANDTYPADFLYDNLMIEANVIDAAHRDGVEKLLFLGSCCIYPKLAPQPITRGCAADRAARADQRMVCDRQDRRDQARPGLSPAIWLRLHLGDADQSLRPRRQFRSRTAATSCRR